MRTEQTIRRQFEELSKQPHRIIRGQLAERYDGIGQFVLVSLANSSTSGALRARVASGDFGNGRIFPRGTPVILTSVRGFLEVFLGGSARTPVPVEPLLLVSNAYSYNATVSLPYNPVPGNTLMLYVASRNNQPLTVPGMTRIAAVLEYASFVRYGSLFYRVVQAGDGKTWGTGEIQMHSLTQWHASYEGIYAAQSQIVDAADVNCGGSVTPPTGERSIILGGATCGSEDYNGVHYVTPDSNITELVDEVSVGDMPLIWVAYREVLSPSGSYTIHGTIDIGGRPYCGVTAVMKVM